MTSIDPTSDRHPNARELFVAFLLLLAMTVGQLCFVGKTQLIVHPPWLDECLAMTLLDDPSFGHAMTALSHGGNHSPPAPLILLRPLRWISGRIDVVDLRVASALAGILTGVAVFAIARARCDRISAFAAASSLWAMPVFIDQLYEARPYILWLCATAWFCFFFGKDRKRIANVIYASLLAALVATLHWYGALALLAIGAVDFAQRRSLKRMIPFLCGAVALACCLPVLIAQRRALVVPTWVEPVSFMQTGTMLTELFCVLPPVLASVLFWIAQSGGEDDAPRSGSLAALLILPALLLALSLAGQPATLSRYSIATILPLCVMTGVILSKSGGRFAITARVLALIGIVAWGVVEQSAHRNVSEDADAIIVQGANDVHDVLANNGAQPIVFLRRHEMYPLINLDPAIAKSVALLNFNTGDQDWLSVTQRFEQQMARIDHTDYPQYQLVDYSTLVHGAHFFVVVPPQAGIDLRQVFPGAQIRPRSPMMFELVTK